nr:hypothetical protein [uncultured Desulfobacter sp.]
MFDSYGMVFKAVVRRVVDAGATNSNSEIKVKNPKTPVIATILGAGILNESITAAGICGAVLAFSGVFILNRME